MSPENIFPRTRNLTISQNNLLNDKSMLTVALEFPVIRGWIDLDLDSNSREIPGYSKDALNTISATISHKLEECGIPALVYASQKWGEVGQNFPNPNLIFVAAINPFTSFKNSMWANEIFGKSLKGRIGAVQAICDQLTKQDKCNWIGILEANYHDSLIKIVKSEFNLCLMNKEKIEIHSEITLPDFFSFKTNMIDSVFVHNLDAYLSGLLREIYHEYIKHIYEKGNCYLFYDNDLPKFSYNTINALFPIWEILSGIGVMRSSLIKVTK